ncbi:RagB/SusD family nutrient uptake outer membrane protein [Bizionia sp. M204]|nr:RagB/SusD family nutrient uptake outer membrane protein [Bizionia sp. M204]
MKTLTINNIFIILVSFFCFVSCEDYLELNDPIGQLPTPEVFEDAQTATSAVTTLYAKLRDASSISGGQTGLGFLMGLYTDELDYYALGEHADSFYQHQIIASDPTVAELWNSSYHIIFMSNSVLEGLENSESLNIDVKNQLRGEALFVRALMHFYLVNLFGDVPYVLTTDYALNSQFSRMPVQDVYEQMLIDLIEAQSLLTSSYVSFERTRPNKWVVTSLMARVYLYLEQWDAAERASTQVINNAGLYDLQVPIEAVFLKASPSAIWQLKPKNAGDNTLEGILYALSSPPPQVAALTTDFIEDMEALDLRRQHWIHEVTDGTDTWYLPYKYQQGSNTGTSMEYSVVFRLSEQYLIRAEARARQGYITDAQADLNAVRLRAGLDAITASGMAELMAAITAERRFELFTEFGHRWFDIKRLGIADTVLDPIKPGWISTQVLLPIPDSELLRNPNLNPQNPGY